MRQKQTMGGVAGGSIVFGIGVLVAAALLSLLLATLRWPSLSIWPTPGPGSWQSYVFWPLFRGLNVLCFVTAAFNVAERTPPLFGRPPWLSVVSVAALALSVAIFIYAFRLLGRDTSYGASAGLNTSGIYQWTRNPQNAMLIVVYACLAVATDTAPTVALCVAMIAVYVLMVRLEEPWLTGLYRESYRAYCNAVPRFFNWRRLWQTISGSKVDERP